MKKKHHLCLLLFTLLWNHIIWPAGRQRPCAILQILQILYTVQAHPEIRLCIVLIPVRLITNKRFPLVVELRVYTQYLIRRQHKNIRILLRRLVERVVVEFHIPHSWGGVKRLVRLRWVHEALFRRRVGAQQCSEVVWADAFVLEQCDEVVRFIMDVWEQAGRRGLGGVFAAYKGSYAGAFGASDGCVIVGVLNEVGVADASFFLDGAENSADVLEAVVFWAVDLAKVHQEGAVGAAVGRVLVPGAGIVKAHADCCAGVVIALAVRAQEESGESI